MGITSRVLNAADRFRDFDSTKKKWSPLGLFLTLAVLGGIIAYTVIVVKRYVEVPTVSSYTEPVEDKRFAANFTCHAAQCQLSSAYGPQSDCADAAFPNVQLTQDESIELKLCYSVDPIDGIIAIYSNVSTTGQRVVFALTVQGTRIILDEKSSNFLEVQDQTGYIKEGTTFLQIIHYWNTINGDKGSAFYPMTIVEDDSVYIEQYGAGSLPPGQKLAHIAPALIYTNIKVSRSSVLSLVGEIGGFLDLLLKGGVVILIVAKCFRPKGSDKEEQSNEMNQM